MAFESLSEKFQNIFANLKGKGRLTEEDVKASMREVKMALLEADVNFKVVKKFVAQVTEKAVGEDVLTGLNPGQMVVKIVKDELVAFLGSEKEEPGFLPGSEVTVLMLCGLQGAGKTTMAAKLAGLYKKNGKNVLLAALDIYRPAAIKQLEVNAEKVGIPMFSIGDRNKVADIAKAAVSHAKQNQQQIVILDTAGRLHVDEDMMRELQEVKEAVSVYKTILVVDSMTGQDAVNVADTFQKEIGIDGVILTKLDGDTRGGAALSIREVTGKPIYYSGIGEKLTDIEPFYPERMANRILGMGDLLSFIEKASENVDVEKTKTLQKKMKKGKFDFNDFYDQMKQMQKMGGIGSLLNMLPGNMGLKGKLPDIDESERQMKKIEAMILSMTEEERANPDLMVPSRRNRIAKGSGLSIDEVNRTIKQFKESQKMMQKLTGSMGKHGNRMKFPFGF